MNLPTGLNPAHFAGLFGADLDDLDGVEAWLSLWACPVTVCAKGGTRIGSGTQLEIFQPGRPIAGRFLDACVRCFR